MSNVPVYKLSKALNVLQNGYENILIRNDSEIVTTETLMWCEYYIKKMLLVLADVERGKCPIDLDIEFKD